MEENILVRAISGIEEIECLEKKRKKREKSGNVNIVTPLLSVVGSLSARSAH